MCRLAPMQVFQAHILQTVMIDSGRCATLIVPKLHEGPCLFSGTCGATLVAESQRGYAYPFIV